jgi:uncharacterized damage-inducible protein DinB
MQDLRYPIGKFNPEIAANANTRAELISQLEEMPRQLRAAAANLSQDQLNTPYRAEGWTVRQVVHHLADAQMNWYIRMRLALTEKEPTIKPYDEALWAELCDARTAPIEHSLILLDGLYQRWIELFRSLSEEQWKCSLYHPERGIIMLDFVLPLSVWHGRHHTAHILELRKRMGW